MMVNDSNDVPMFDDTWRQFLSSWVCVFEFYCESFLLARIILKKLLWITEWGKVHFSLLIFTSVYLLVGI